MAWIESHQSLEKNGKLLTLAGLLGINRHQAIGHLHAFWWWALDNAIDGEITKFSEAVISEISGWNDCTKEQEFLERFSDIKAPKLDIFLNACLQSGFVDEIDGKLFIHSWDRYTWRYFSILEAAETKRINGRKRQRIWYQKHIHNSNLTQADSVSLTQPNASNLTRPNLTKKKNISSDLEGSNGYKPGQLEAIRQIWSEYLTKMGKNPKILTLTSARKQKGLARLSEALNKTSGNIDKAKTLMFLAIESLFKSDWHMGRDPKTNGKKYDSWEENLFRNAEQFEKWLEKSE